MDSRTQRELWPGWETVRLLGRGSFGAVYEIRRDVFGETERAALKLITLPQNDSEIKEMRSEGHEEQSITETFQGYLKSIVAEYSLMRKLSGSTNVVNCEDLRTVQHADGIGWDIYIKMELLKPLTEALPPQVEEPQVIAIGRDLCRALSLCAQFNIVHRDIKPQNIFVSPLGDYKLGDFGVARTMEKTTSGTRTGTFKYMAPEVYHEEPYGSSVDLYSLGLVLYWLLNERRMPFLPLPPAKLTAELEEQSRRRRLRGEPLPPPRLGSAELKKIVLKACAYDPKERYQSAEEMLRELESLGASPQKQEKKPAAESASSAKRQIREKKPADSENRAPKKAGTEKSAEPVRKTGRGKKGLLIAAVLALTVLAGLGLLLRPRDHTGGRAYSALAALDEDAAALLGEGSSCVGYYRIQDHQSGELSIPVPGELEGQSLTVWTLAADGTQSRQEIPASEGGISAALPGGSRVLLLAPTPALSETGWGAWTDALPTGRALDEQAQALWESRFRLRETCFSQDPNLAGWDLEGKVEADYGPWSPWQLSEIEAAEDLEVQSGTVYRSRTMESTTSQTALGADWELQDTRAEYGEWGAWSDWSESARSQSDTCSVQTKTQCMWVLEEDFTLPGSDEERWYPVATGEWVDESEYDITVQPGEYQRVSTRRRTLYRWQERPASYTYTYVRWGEWSQWKEEALTAAEDMQVESAQAWRSREIRRQYSYGDWSEWSTEPIEETESLQVEEGTVYRFRDRESSTSQTPLGEDWELQDTQAEYGEWGGWSDWSESARQQSDSCNVQAGTQYRWVYATDYQDAGTYYYEVMERGAWEYDEASARASAPKTDGFHSVSIETRSVYRWQERPVSYTYTYARWGEWSPWSEEAAEATENREVETAAGWRSRERQAQEGYRYSRWGEWSPWQQVLSLPDGEVETESRLQYRCRS